MLELIPEHLIIAAERLALELEMIDLILKRDEAEADGFLEEAKYFQNLINEIKDRL